MSLNIPCVFRQRKLQEILAKTDISVSARTKGRNNDQTENWVMCRLLSTLAHHQKLKMPVRVVHRDRPDFFLRQRCTGIGAEVTEAIPQEFAAFCALQEREFPGKWIEPAHFRLFSPKMTTNEMRQLLRQTKLTSDGWAGDSPEREWAVFMELAIDKKAENLKKQGYEKFKYNWLAIYDNLPYHAIHLGDAIKNLKPILENRWQVKPFFDVIFIEHGPVIAKITKSGTQHFKLNDLWELT